MTKRPYMPLYIGDYKGDTLHLSTLQDGVYLNLLMAMWTAGGKLPNDDELLARIAKVSVNSWHRLAKVILPFFIIHPDHIENARLNKELRKVKAKSEARAEAGRKGGKARRASGAGAKKVEEIPSETRASEASKSLKNGLDVEAIASSDSGARVMRAGDLRLQTPEKDGSTEPSLFPDQPAADQGLPERRLLSEFETRFWKAYPHKVSKGAARRAWLKARRKASADEILDGIIRYKAAKPADRAWQHPATWLNGEGWLDDPAPPPIEHRHARAPPAAGTIEAETEAARQFLAKIAKSGK